MSDCLYSVIRYVADPIRNEPVNIGLVIYSAEEHVLKFKFEDSRVDLPKPDRETLKHYAQELLPIQENLVRWEEAAFETIPVSDPLFLFRVSDYIGNTITFDAPRGCRTDDLAHTFDELFNQFVAVHTAAAARPQQY